MKRYALISALACVAAFTAHAADKKIERLYSSKCASCHGKDGKAQTEKGKKMAMRDVASEDFQKLTDAEMTKAINEGLKKEKNGVKQEMDGYKEELDAAQVEGLVKYLREFKK